MNSNWSYNPETLNSGKNRRFFLSRVTFKFDGWPWKTIGDLFYATSSFVHHFIAISEVTVRKRPIRFKINNFMSRVTLKFDRWPWKTIECLLYATSNFVLHLEAIKEFKLELQSGSAQLGTKSPIFVPCDLEIWQRTLKNNIVTLLWYFKLYASFRSQLWIQNGVMVRKRLNWVKICFDLRDLDLWPLTFCMDMTLSMVITTENFRMVRWQEHCQKSVTGGRTDGQTEGKSCLVAAKNLTCHADKRTNTTQSISGEKSLPAQSNYIYWDSAEPGAYAKQTYKTFS